MVDWITSNNLWTNDTTNYPGLFGNGDGTTTFVLPDYRGQFIRGYDSSGTIDADRNTDNLTIGSQQEYAVETFHVMMSYNNGSHTWTYSSRGGDIISSTYYHPIFKQSANTDLDEDAYMKPYKDGTITPMNQGSETRPNNIVLYACIKY